MKTKEDTSELETCEFCGYLVESPCEEPPPDYCHQLTQEDFDIIEEKLS